MRRLLLPESDASADRLNGESALKARSQHDMIGGPWKLIPSSMM
jgi:hypothetical protein